MRRLRFGVVCVALSSGVAALAVSACQSGLTDGAQPVVLDEAYFRCRVQPILTKSCSAFLCHGDARRYFKMFARNRLRLGGTEDERNATMRDSERAFNYESARLYVDANDPEESLLLLKPLDQAAGGYFHGGATEYDKGDVFLTRDEPDYKVLDAWIKGATEDPACIEPGSNL